MCNIKINTVSICLEFTVEQFRMLGKWSEHKVDYSIVNFIYDKYHS